MPLPKPYPPNEIDYEDWNDLTNKREAIKTVKKLAKSETEDVRVFAVDAFLKLSSLAGALAEALGKWPERRRSPLSRIFRG